jgi:hypothetical protein
LPTSAGAGGIGSATDPFIRPTACWPSAIRSQTEAPGGRESTSRALDLTVRAEYRITARILARERYHFDTLSDLVPEDLALGWGPMSDNRILRSLDIYQANRFYFWRAPALRHRQGFHHHA